MALPPGPAAPAAVQTWEWVARPTALLRRCHARYGEPFTLRTLWADGPLVLVSDPDSVRAVLTAGPEVLRGGASSRVLEPFTGPRSILVLDGPEHLEQRRRMLPAFHGEALGRWRPAIAALARDELATWRPGEQVDGLARMRRLTLEVILRVVLGGPDPELRDAVRRTLDLTASLGRLAALSLLPPDSRAGPWAAFRRAVQRLDVVLERRIREAPDDGSVLAVLRAASPPAEVRDELVTLLAAGHETTATALAWALERLARHPGVLARMREGDDAYLDAVAKEVLRARPVLSIAARKAVAPFAVANWTLPPGTHVAACLYLAHRRAGTWGDPLAFRPERFLGAAPTPSAFAPFGGGVRRCLGAAFAALEMREVLRVLAARFALRPDRPAGERMRRRSVTLAPARGARVVPEPLASAAAPRCRSSAATTA